MQVKYSKQAEKFLKTQPTNLSQRIRTAISNLPAGDVKKLKECAYYRLRVGNFRIIFDINGNVIYVEKIDSCGQVYK